MMQMPYLNITPSALSGTSPKSELNVLHNYFYFSFGFGGGRRGSEPI